MKASFPLSLKVSLWLLLNLLLVGLGAGALFIKPGGLGWETLMDGPAGARFQTLGDVIVAEANAAAPDARTEVLDRFGHAYGADFFLFANRGQQLAGAPVAPPPAVRAALVPPAGAPGGPNAGPDGPPPESGPELGAPPNDAPPPEREPAQRAAARGRGRFLVNAGDLGYWVGLRVPFRPPEARRPSPATLLVRVDSRWTLLRLLDLQSWFLAIGVIVVFSILFWLPFVRAITRALGQLTAATGRIAEGRFETRVPETRRDEIGALGGSVNRMAQRLDTLVNGQKRFLADVAHELGSPIGRLQVAVEILESRADPALQEQVADVRDEVQQMSALVNELLAFTKAGLRPPAAELAAVELAPLVAQAVDREAATARVAVDVPPALAARADAPLLSRAIGNLVRNAIRYAGDATPISITARRADNRVIVTVADEGPGVPPDALARLGEPFYRPEAARTRETGGVGLGLAIVRSGVAACGGEVRFSNRAPCGFSAEIGLAAV